MKMIIGLIFILYFFTFSLHLESEDCCPLKSVGGTLYKFVEHVSEEERKRLKCSNTCAYEHAEKDSEIKYCFKPGKLESSCEGYAMFMVGGYTNRTGVGVTHRDRSMGLYIPSKNKFCELSIEFPVDINRHATSEFTVCGGWYGPIIDDSFANNYDKTNQYKCRTLNVADGQWINTWNLTAPCPELCQSWESDDGFVLVRGEKNALLQADGNTNYSAVAAFPNFKAGCLISDPTDNTAIITGGNYIGLGEYSYVYRYGINGIVEKLPDMNVARLYHACTGFFADDKFVALVAGSQRKPFSTETFTFGKDTSWQLHNTQTNPLPNMYAAAVTIDNSVFMTGHSYPAIGKWNHDTKEWIKVQDVVSGYFPYFRYGFQGTVSRVPLKSGIENWCKA